MSAPGQLDKEPNCTELIPDSTSSDPDTIHRKKKRRKKNPSAVIETVSTVSAAVETFHTTDAKNFTPVQQPSCKPVPCAFSKLPNTVVSPHSTKQTNSSCKNDDKLDDTNKHKLNISTDSLEDTLSLLPMPKISVPVPGICAPVSLPRTHSNTKTNTYSSVYNMNNNVNICSLHDKQMQNSSELESLSVKLRNDENLDLPENKVDNNLLPKPSVSDPLPGANNTSLPLINLSPISKSTSILCASDNVVHSQKLLPTYPKVPEVSNLPQLPEPKVCMPVGGLSNTFTEKPRLSRDDSGFVESSHSLDRLSQVQDVKKDSISQISSYTSDLNYTQTSEDISSLSKVKKEGSAILSSQDSAYAQSSLGNSSRKSQKYIDSQTSAEEQVKHRAAGKEGYTDECMICLTGPKEASLIHGKVGHQVCCYHCAKKLYKRGKSCPICRRPVEKVVRNYIM